VLRNSRLKLSTSGRLPAVWKRSTTGKVHPDDARLLAEGKRPVDPRRQLKAAGAGACELVRLPAGSSVGKSGRYAHNLIPFIGMPANDPFTGVRASDARTPCPARVGPIRRRADADRHRRRRENAGVGLKIVTGSADRRIAIAHRSSRRRSAPDRAASAPPSRPGEERGGS
jgi:hypothetical protein